MGAEVHWEPLACLRHDYSGNISLIKLNTPFSSVDDMQLFAHLWRHAVTKACTDGAANILHDCEQLNKDHFIPNYISGDFDSIRSDVLDFYRTKGCEILPTPDQNATDFTKCLRHLIKTLNACNLKYDSIVVHVSTGGRLDHIMANINTLFTACSLTSKPVYLLSSESVSCLLSPGTNTIDVNSTKRGYWCSLVPIGASCKSVTTSGLAYNLNKQQLKFGELVSTSNDIDGAATVVTVETDEHLLWSMSINLLSI